MTKEKTIEIFEIAANARAKELFALITEPLENETVNGIITGHDSPIHVLVWMEKVHAVQTRKADELKEILQAIRKLEDDYLVMTNRELDANEL